jgi:glyoxylase-like metal-dependent hydrolase (beta-lactamase superfamily II)
MKIADGVEVLELTADMMGRVSTVHPTLIWDQQAVVLVDTGYPGQLPAIRTAVDQAGAGFDRLNRIILTHHDIDHIGGLASLRRELDGQVQVLAYTEEIPYIDGEKRPLKLAQLEASLDTLPEERKQIYERMKSGFQNSFAPVDQGLTDGQDLPFCGGVTVIHTPGHTIGHICLYLRQSKTLIAGDALRVENGDLTQTPSSANYDQDRYRHSLEKLAKYDIDAVISYHGGLYRGAASKRIAALARVA